MAMENTEGKFLNKLANEYLNDLNSALWIFDIDYSKVVWANKSALTIWNSATLEELLEKDMAPDMSISVAQRLKQYQVDFIRSNTSYTEVWTLYPNNIPTTIDVVFRGYEFDDGRMGLLCEVIDKREDTPEGLRSSEALLHTSVMISLYDKSGLSLYHNPASHNSQTDSNLELEYRFVNQKDYDNLIRCLSADGTCRQSVRIKTSYGIRWHEIIANECMDAVTGHNAILLSETDVTDLKKTEQHARYLADHDTLTGLPNRNYVQSQLSSQLETASINQEKFAILIIDLDKFKIVNDTLGHTVGDKLLVQVSKRLSAITSQSGMVARLGGDEFLICLTNIQDQNQIEQFCAKLIEEFKVSFTIDERQIHSTLSIGVSVYPEDGRNLPELLKNADVAMYEAKHDGRNTFSSFNVSLRNKMEKQLVLERDLNIALKEEQFELYYQPRVDTQTNIILGCEALIRWNHPTLGMLPPSAFIETAEEIGLINEIGEWVMNEAALYQHFLEVEGYPITISINVSPKQFQSSTFFSNVLSLQSRTKCDPTKIELEITETTLMSGDNEVLQKLQSFKECGFGIAIDDFGTGYSNLAYIQNYPITSLKIDKSFISNIGTSHEVTQLIISLCKLIQIKAVAEGVETQEQLVWLQQHGCTEYQGFWYSPPVEKSKFMELLMNQFSIGKTLLHIHS